MIDAKYDLALVGDVYAEVFLHFFKFDVLTAILQQLICPFFSGNFSENLSDGLFGRKNFVDRYCLKLRSSRQRVLSLEV